MMRSLTKFLDAATVSSMLLVVPDREIANFSEHSALQGLPWPLRIVPDSELLSLNQSAFERIGLPQEKKIYGGRGVNYRMQMLIKLSVARVVTTTFYLVLDCGEAA
eukprot:7378850-Prymnesium_polylepis.1